MTTRSKYEQMKKKRTISMLEKLLERIKNGQLLVEDSGFWITRLDNNIIFRVVAISKDDERELEHFE